MGLSRPHENNSKRLFYEGGKRERKATSTEKVGRTTKRWMMVGIERLNSRQMRRRCGGASRASRHFLWYGSYLSHSTPQHFLYFCVYFSLCGQIDLTDFFFFYCSSLQRRKLFFLLVFFSFQIDGIAELCVQLRLQVAHRGFDACALGLNAFNVLLHLVLGLFQFLLSRKSNSLHYNTFATVTQH